MANIVFHLTLSKAVKDKNVEITLTEPVPLLDFLAGLEFPSDQVGLVIRNGRWAAKADCMIHDEDHIDLFPHLQGG